MSNVAAVNHAPPLKLVDQYRAMTTPPNDNIAASTANILMP
jgi:hypothetical protein